MPLAALLVVVITVPIVAVVALTGSSSTSGREGAAPTPATAAATPTTTRLPSGAPQTSAPSPGAPSPSAPPPTAADIAAARACAAFTTYLADAGQGRVPPAAGQALSDDAYRLLDGASQDQAAGKPLPQWANLGEYLIAAADDVVNNSSSALSKDGPAAAQLCQTIPTAARVAGGYTPATNPAPKSSTTTR